MKAAPFHGLLVLDKPAGMTSRDVVDRALRWFPRGTRMGHTGTLDPLATGVLVLCVGSATRLTEYIQNMPKTYQSLFLLGARSDTDDADGTITSVTANLPDRGAISEQLPSFVGEIEQVPPAYSAAKVTGRRAYELARQGRGVLLQPRRVRINSINLVDYVPPRLSVEVHCGRGTYIRSLARDLGERLGCGALVETLRRTRVGQFTIAEVLPLDAAAETARTALRPLAEAVAELPRVLVSGAEAAALRHGRGIPLRQKVVETETIAVFDAGGLVAVARVEGAKQLLLPEKVVA
jgi:tRNA pseudouridine55 synthase